MSTRDFGWGGVIPLIVEKIERSNTGMGVAEYF